MKEKTEKDLDNSNYFRNIFYGFKLKVIKENKMLYFCPLFFPFPLLGGGRGCHRRLGEESKHPCWAESQEDQGGEMGLQSREGRDPDGPGEVDSTWERATGRAKSRG